MELQKAFKLRDELEQYGRWDNLEFHEIPVLPNKNTNYVIKMEKIKF